jgi:hypothetical protein
MSQKKLCVCGRSAQFPLCDESHVEQGWTCVVGAQHVQRLFCGSSRYRNLAQKLGWHFKGALVEVGEALPSADQLILVLDATEIAYPRAIFEQAGAPTTTVFCLSGPAAALGAVFPGAAIVPVEPVDLLEAFKWIRRFIKKDSEVSPQTPGQAKPLASAFISHAVADEPLILPAVEFLRDSYQLELFLCADSIPPGAEWREKIELGLRSSDHFVNLVSTGSYGSTYCAYETGMAVALKRPVSLISLDGSRPPAFVQHLNAIDLQRQLLARPWLSRTEALVDALLQVLSGGLRA